MKKSIFLLFVFATILMSCEKHDERSDFYSYNYSETRDYTASLSNQRVNDIYEDTDGFVWISTFRGLNKYDGKRYSQFFCFDDKRGLNDNQVNAVKRDQQGRMWVATVNGVCIYRDNDRFSRVVVDHADKNIIQILVATDGRVFFANSHVLMTYDEESDRIVEIRNGHPFVQMAKYYAGTDNTIWAVAPDRIIGYDARELRVLGEYQTPFTIKTSQISEEGLIWFSGNAGFTYFNTISRQFSQIVKPDVIGTFHASETYILLPIGRNHVLFANNDGYLYLCSLERNAIVRQDEKSFPFEAPHLKNIRCIFRDRNHNLWFGLEDDGFYVAKRYKDIFSGYLELRNHLAGNPVTSVVASADGGTLYVATKHSGIDVYDSGSDTFTSYENIKTQMLYSDSRGLLWTARDKSPMVDVYSNAGGRLVLRNSIEVGDVISIAEDANGNMWFGTIGENIYKYVVLDGSLKPIRAFRDNIFTFTPGLLPLDGNKMLVASFSHKPAVVDINTDEAEYLPVSDADFNECVKRSVFLPTGLYKGKDGRIWIGTIANGLLCYDSNNHRMSKVNGAPCQDISGIVYGQDGNLWVSTMHGVGCFKRSTGQFVNFITESGDSGNQFYDRAACIMNDGTIVFGGTHGISTIKPKQSNDTITVPFVFENIKINNQVLRPSADGALPVMLSLKPDVVLDHDQNSFSILFAALDYTHSGRSHYYYRLDGYDRQWNDAGSNPEAFYTRVRPGRYRFHVRYVDDSGNIQPMEDEFNLRVKPNPWTSLLALSLYFVFAVAVVVSIYSMRRQVRHASDERRRLEYEKEQEKKLNKMHMSFFANVAHEFRTPLTMISGPLNILSEKLTLEKGDRKLMDVMQRNVNRMLGLVNQFLDFNRLEDGTFKLEVARHNITEDLRKLAEAFEVSGKIKGLYLLTDGLDEDCYIYYDQDKVIKMVTNLLSNALKYTKEGSIKLGFFNDNGGRDAVIYVQDTGIGVPEELREKIFERYFRVEDGVSWGAGIGLYYVRALAKSHHGTVICEPNVEGDKEIGSIFTITFPATEGAYQSTEHARAGKTQQTQFPLLQEVEESEVISHQEETDKRKVLVVDDDPDICNYLKILLGNSNFAVQTCYDAETALAKIKEWEPQIVLSDVSMPGTSGMELCKSMRKDLSISHIPVILVTAKTTTADQVAGIDSGADAYITKPFDPKYLIAVLNSQLEKRQHLQRALNENTDTEALEAEDNLSMQDKAFLKQLYSVMEESVSDIELDINAIANSLHISRTKLYYKVKGLTGESPAAFFKNYKLNKAAEMICSGKYNVSEISDMTGFASLSHFSTSFKKHFGMTPSEYAKNKK